MFSTSVSAPARSAATSTRSDPFDPLSANGGNSASISRVAAS